jgi:ABC-type dipeptide/oligopeptide/nickel transport system permease component
MLRYVVRRVLVLLAVQFGVLALVFVIMRLVPGNPAEIMLGAERTQEDIDTLMREWGYDRPLPEQLGRYLAHLLQGDLGRSISSRLPVLTELRQRFLMTVQVAVSALMLGTGLGVCIGIFASVHRGQVVDRLSTMLSLVGVSFPSFWIGLTLMMVFAARLRWLPAIGSGTPRHMVLPVLTLMLGPLAVSARQTRSAMLEVLGEEYVTTARAKGLPERTVIASHAFRNAAIPVVTMVGLSLGHLLGGSIIVETVFGLPGIGKLIVDAIAARDYPVVQGASLLFALVFGLTNLLVDLAYGWLDPRIRLR